MLRYLLTVLFFVILAWVFSGNHPVSKKVSRDKTPISNKLSLENWVDSVFTTLTPDQRIAQLFIIAVDSDKGEANDKYLEQLISKHNPGGVCFFDGTPKSQAELTNKLQNAAKVPLFVAMDAEWGPAMRLEGVTALPYQITLGAITDNDLIYYVGVVVGKQLKRLGVNMSFSPVVDVNNNPKNPVINFRSFGESRENVAQKGMAYIRGLQDSDIIAVAKHFPGHGDTKIDSHHGLPLINLSKQELDSIHLYPFRQLVKIGIDAIMVGHLDVPALELIRNTPATLSESIISKMLQKDWGFEGLVITDALNMGGVTSAADQDKLEVKALKAGNDILLMPQSLTAAINRIKIAIKTGNLSQDIVDKKVIKILRYKYLVGLNKPKTIKLEGLVDDLNHISVNRLNTKLAESAITLLQNKNSTIPLTDLEEKKIALLSIGAPAGNPFQKMIMHHVDANQYSILKNHGRHQTNRMLKILENYDLVIVGIHHTNISVASNYGVNRENIYLANQLASRQPAIITVFANPYSIEAFGSSILNASAIVLGYQDGKHFEEAAAQVIVGGIGAKGKLPVSLKPLFPLFKGDKTLDNFRVKLGFPEDVGINTSFLAVIDTIVNNGIDSMAFPGAQVAVVKDGVVIYHKAFGHHTHEKNRPVELTDLYDLASITKIVATTASIMNLADRGKIGVEQTLGKLLNLPKNSDKRALTLRRILAHNAQLRAWMPFFSNTLDQSGAVSSHYYSSIQTEIFPTQVAKDLFIKKGYTDRIYQDILQSELLRRNRYMYSDLGFILLTKIINDIAGIPLDKYFETVFSRPMGLSSLIFNPLKKYPLGQVVPTEIDNRFRLQVIHGHVNDPTAAMMGGVSGHTGLFSNALHLAIFMNVLLAGGQYAGMSYFKPQTIRRFTTAQFANLQNRRALGFDKPDKNYTISPAAKSASANSFGHLGFTGTFAWADPDESLVVVFLSNRTYPKSSNRLINEVATRKRIHQAVYDAIEKSRSAIN